MAVRVVAFWACLAFVSMCGDARADEPVTATIIVERAIEAAGGRDALARYKHPFRRVSEGTLPGRNGPTAFEIKVTALLPDKLRTDQKMPGGEKFSIVFDGDKGWHSSSGAAGGRTFSPPKVGPQALDDGGIKRTRDMLYGQWLTTLLPLVDDAVKLTKLDDLLIDGRPALGLNVSRQDRPDVQLYFDKETFALVKLARKANDRSYEEYYHNYGELDGLKYPRVVEQHFNGKKAIEMQTKELTFLDEVEQGTFDQP